jgi:hypothetical protein
LSLEQKSKQNNQKSKIMTKLENKLKDFISIGLPKMSQHEKCAAKKIATNR